MTQQDRVKQLLSKAPKTIKQIAEETNILTPNIRRIVGVGAKEGTFKRLSRGVYILSHDNQDVAFVYTANAAKKLPELAAQGLKVDMVFLDPPYTTSAVQGRHRPQRFKTISPATFQNTMNAIAQIVRTENTPVYYICSEAPSGLLEMDKYNRCLSKAGFKIVAKGHYTKLQSDGIKLAINVRGVPCAPEAIYLFTKSGNFAECQLPRNLEFSLIRPPVTGKNGRQTQKPPEMLKSLILQGTNPGELILDPYAGTGVTAVEAVRLGRKVVAIEVDNKVVKHFILPRLQAVI